MTVLFSCEETFRAHDSGPGHPERPQRIDAVATGIRNHHLDEMVAAVAPRAATDEELIAVHSRSHVARVDRFCELGGGSIDTDTHVGPRSAELARLGSGTFLAAVEQLEAGAASGAFVAVRPPGHHATRDRAMGFCLYNHIAVAAASLVSRGARVAVVDIDAHHGNGTQDIFYDEPEVLYVSWHQSPHYPYTGYVDEVGSDAARGTTLNVPVPNGTTGDHYRRSIEELVAPAVESFGADWMLISAGFDAHRADPLCDLGLSSGDVGDITADLMGLVGPGRTAALLEGGYDLGAIADCSAAVVSALGGVRLHPEAPTSGGPGEQFVLGALEARRRATG